MRTEILEGALTKEQREAGYYLVEDDDHFLNLYQGARTVGVFCQTGATIEEIRETVEWDMRTI